MTYDEAVRAADMFTAALAEAGHPLEKPARVTRDGNEYGYRWQHVTPDHHVENKARLLVAHTFGRTTACARCWIESDYGLNRDRWLQCRDGNCPYDHEVATDA